MMKTRASGLRMAVAAGGAALMLVVAGCGSDASDAEENPSDAADAMESTEAGVGEDDAADDEAGSGDSADSAAVAAPGEDFDPCDVLDSDEISGITGFEVSDSRESGARETGESKGCLFQAERGTNFARITWWPSDRSMDDMVDEADDGMVHDADDPEEVTVRGASEAHVITGDTQLHQVGASLAAKVKNGYFLTIVTGDLVEDTPDVDASVELTELTISRA